MSRYRRACVAALAAFVFFGAGGSRADDPETFDSRSAALEELDRRCEAAREKKIAPLREAEIAQCKADKRNDPAYCERFWKDYGESTRTVDGRFVPRMFNDLTECLVADRERKRRARE